MNNMESSCFFGFFDPDGRPWGTTSERLDRYQRGLEAAFKIAFLTQSSLDIPAGYFLDNPAMQRIFFKYRHDDVESTCFRKLAKDGIRIAANESSDSQTEAVENWNQIFDDWAIGSGSNRNQQVYLNCLPLDTARQLQEHTDSKFVVRSLHSGIQSLYGVDYREYLGVLDGVKFNRVSLGAFDFESLVRENLLGEIESFSKYGVGPVLLDKVREIGESTSEAKVRISRSVLASPFLCRELGVKERSILSREEYDALVPALAHYHHYAFAKSLGLHSIVTSARPDEPEIEEGCSLLEAQIVSILDDLSSPDNGIYSSWPLKDISYEDIWNVRLGKKASQFEKTLQDLHYATALNDKEGYRDALKTHGRHIQAEISCKFSEVNPKELARGMDKSIAAGGDTAEGALSIAKSAFTFFREFVPNIRKEIQLRHFFRKIDIS